MIRPRQHGFTLAEAIIVIAITGIIAAVVAVFIVSPVKGYVDSAARAELTDVADTALRRMARDLRLALPNSIRVTPTANGGYLELLLTSSGGRYLAEGDNPLAGNRFLRFGQAIDCAAMPDHCRFDVIGPLPDPPIVPNRDDIVVYNLGPGQAPANAYDCTGACNRARITAVNGNTITLANNPFATQAPPMASPNSRFQVVTTPVTYFCNGGADGTGSITRYWSYAIQPEQPVDAAAAPLSGASSALLTNRVVRCTFEYSRLANIRSALVDLSITLEIPGSDSGSITLFHQVHVDNTP